MRLRSIALLAIALACTAAAAPASGAERGLTAREAAIAVREEVGANWFLLETVPRGPESRSTTVTVDCAGISPRRRLCTWEARNPDRGQVAEGLASVIDHVGGADARLYAYRCKVRAGLSCL